MAKGTKKPKPKKPMYRNEVGAGTGEHPLGYDTAAPCY